MRDSDLEKRYQKGKKISILTIIGNIILAFVKIIVGLIVNSTGLIADGFHSMSDTASTLVVLIAMKIADQPPDDDHPYGHGQAEPIAAKILGIILLFTGGFLVYNTLKQINAGNIRALDLTGLWAVALSIILKEIMYRCTFKIGEQTNNQALKADAWHHRSDAISSLAAGGGIIGSYLGYPILDPLAGLIVAAMIIWVGWNIVRDAISSLMGTSPPGDKMQLIKEQVRTIDGVEEVSGIKGHYYGVDLYLDLNILVDYRLTVLEGHEIAAYVKSTIAEEHRAVKEVMVHVDPMLPER